MNRRPCVVGLTGGLASGKSTVAAILAARGVPVFDADAGVHQLYRAGQQGAVAVAGLFGEGVMDIDGGVDREALAKLVMGDANARGRLEAAVHPLVRGLVEDWLQSLGDEPIAIVEAALLVETGSWRNYDVLVVVWCEPEQQIERAQARSVPEDRARSLLAAQLPLEEKQKIAHIVIDNRGDQRDLRIEVEKAIPKILRYCAGAR